MTATTMAMVYRVYRRRRAAFERHPPVHRIFYQDECRTGKGLEVKAQRQGTQRPMRFGQR